MRLSYCSYLYQMCSVSARFYHRLRRCLTWLCITLTPARSTVPLVFVCLAEHRCCRLVFTSELELVPPFMRKSECPRIIINWEPGFILTLATLTKSCFLRYADWRFSPSSPPPLPSARVQICRFTKPVTPFKYVSVYPVYVCTSWSLDHKEEGTEKFLSSSQTIIPREMCTHSLGGRTIKRSDIPSS